MIVAFDANVMLLAVRPDAGIPEDPETKRPITEARERILYLIETLERAEAQIVFPTPALAELLVRAGSKAPAIVDYLDKQSVFRLAPLDKLAAIELAEMNRAIHSNGDKKDGVEEPWQKIKVDRQIVAIARVERAGAIYTTDRGLRTFAERQGLNAIGVHELPLPPKQTTIFSLLQGASDNEQVARPDDTF